MLTRRNRAGPPVKETTKKGVVNISPNAKKTSQSKPASPNNPNQAVTIVKKQRRASDGRSLDLGTSQSSSVESLGRNGFAGLSMSTK